MAKKTDKNDKNDKDEAVETAAQDAVDAETVEVQTAEVELPPPPTTEESATLRSVVEHANKRNDAVVADVRTQAQAAIRELHLALEKLDHIVKVQA